MTTPTPNEAARSLADRFWEDLLEIEPVIGTEVGDERFDDRLGDPSDAGVAHRESVARQALRDVAAIDRSQLDQVTRTTLDVMEAIAKREVASIEHRLDRLAAVSHFLGPGSLLADLASLQRTDTPERRERYFARLRDFPRYLDAMREVAMQGVASGQLSPGLVVDRTIAQLERLLALQPEESPAVQALADAPAAEKERGAAIFRDEIAPAYGRYLEMLREYRPHATETIGLLALPNGAAMYGAEILSWTTLPLDPQQVHDLGNERLAAIQEERAAIAAGLGFASAEAAIEAHQASGRNTAATREEVVRLAEEQVRRGWEASKRFFGRMPKANCAVKPVEEYREQDMPFAFYFGPTADGSRAGIYYINTSDLPERPLHHLATTTYHEANPGHHLQVSIEQEIPDRPNLRRFGGILAGSAFIEGWGLYSERLADEMGIFEDGYERLGMLDAQAHRAARLIVDTGIHALGWSREQSVAKLREAAVPDVDAQIETDRYITMPGQALAYMIGMTEIERWRRDAADREGAAFSLPAFHDRLLALGSLPLPALQREMGGP
jgi:uncharacterized protein (DUF885 family)